MERSLLRRGKMGLWLAAIALAGCSSTSARAPGREIVWESERIVAPATGAASTAASTSPAGSPDGCREYTHTVIIDGKEQQAYGRACPQPDGSWRVDLPTKLPQASNTPVPTPIYPVRTYPAYYYPPVFFGSAFYFSGHRHRHHHWHRHRRFR